MIARVLGGRDRAISVSVSVSVPAVGAVATRLLLGVAVAGSVEVDLVGRQDGVVCKRGAGRALAVSGASTTTTMHVLRGCKRGRSVAGS